MIAPRSRALLDRYALASTALVRTSGERLATEPGQSVEFHDFRPYQSGDELRYVDWRVYARTGRLYTRLHRAERAIHVHVVLDTSPSMRMGPKAAFARSVASLLAYVGQRDARSQVHLFDGRSTPPSRGRAAIGEAWRFIDDAPTLAGDETLPVRALTDFALRLPPREGTGLAIVVSDLFDEASLRPALAAFRSRKLDASFLQVLSSADLRPDEGQLELIDVESDEELRVSPDEVRAYRQAVRRFVDRVRSTILQAGYRHTLLEADAEGGASAERQALEALIREGILVRR